MNEKKLGNLLSRPDSPLAGIVERARAMETLTAAVRAALSEDARAHLVSAARRDDGTLVLVTESSAWAARLRFAPGAKTARGKRSADPRGLRSPNRREPAGPWCAQLRRIPGPRRRWAPCGDPRR